jgi:hypothetical protein
MSNIRVNTITDEVGTGAPDFPNGYTVAGAVPAAPESGVQTFTATGALANGDLVGLNPDGTVSVVSPYSLQTTNANAVSSTWVSSTFDTLNNKVVVFYIGSSNYLNSVVGTISGSTISFGTPVVVLSSNCVYTSCTFDTLNNKVVVATLDQTTASIKAFVGTVSGTTISFGAAATVYSANSRWPVLTFDSINNKVVVVYGSSTAPYPMYSKVGTVSGTTVSFGTQATIATEGNNYPNDVTFSSATGKIVVFYVTGTNKQALAVGTVSGTSISYGATLEISNSTTPAFGSVAYDSTTGSVVVLYYATNGYNSAVCNISGTSISLGSVSLIFNLGIASFQKLIGVGNGTFVFMTFDSYGNFYRMLMKTDGVITSLSLSSRVIFAGGGSSIGLVFDPVNNLVVASYKASSTGFLTADLVDPFSPTLTWVGIAAEAIANGASGKVTVTGGINSGQTGLTTGALYGYNTSTGALTIGGDNLGLAISPTQLYIK